MPNYTVIQPDICYAYSL